MTEDKITEVTCYGCYLYTQNNTKKLTICLINICASMLQDTFPRESSSGMSADCGWSPLPLPRLESLNETTIRFDTLPPASDEGEC